MSKVHKRDPGIQEKGTTVMDEEMLERGISVIVTADPDLQPQPVLQDGTGTGPTLEASWPLPSVSPRPEPEVRTAIVDGALEVTVVGDSRARQVLALSLAPEPWLEGEADGPVERLTRPSGSHARVRFPLVRALPSGGAEPAVFVDWEDAIQMPSLAALDVGGEGPIRVNEGLLSTAPEFDDEEFFDRLVATKECLSEEGV